tara:strand:- start:906 stop:1556 length:651 start_codon:yes stop_codon:yes gene_type:complete
MTTFRQLFKKVDQIRKHYKIPTDIAHTYSSEDLTKADEIFYDFKCENNLFFPLRYAELHRILSVSYKKKDVAFVRTTIACLEDSGLISVLLEKGCCWWNWEDDTLIFHNFKDAQSVSKSTFLRKIYVKYAEDKITQLEALYIRGIVVGVDPFKNDLLIQAHPDFETRFRMDLSYLHRKIHKLLLAEAPMGTIKRMSKHMTKHRKCYERRQKILHNA